MNAVEEPCAAPKLPDHSIAKRYAWKLVANGLGLPLLAFIQSCSARLLGPTAFGEFSFITNAFSQLFSFLEAGSSEGLYTKLAQRPDERALLSFYSVVAILLFGAGCVITTLILFSGFSTDFFPSVSQIVIWLGMLYAFSVWASQIIQRVVDCYGLTVQGEISRTIVRLIAALLIGALFLGMDRLSIRAFFLYQFFVLVLTTVCWLSILKRHGLATNLHTLQQNQFFTYAREFRQFCGPLVIYSVISLITGFFDRWFLQHVAGSNEQGYFALGNQIAMFCFVFSSAMVPIFIREFSRAFARNDHLRMQSLFDRLIPRLFALTGMLGIFVAINAKPITIILGGSTFEQAAATVLVLALYPLHQTFGQFSGSLFYITGQTRLYRNIGVLAMLSGMLLTVVLVGPSAKGFLQLGAFGLAIKTVAQQFTMVAVQLWFNCRFLKSSFTKHLRIQFNIVLLFSVLAWIAQSVAVALFDSAMSQLLTSVSIYSVFCLVSLALLPRTFGFTVNEIRSLLHESIRKLIHARRRFL